MRIIKILIAVVFVLGLTMAATAIMQEKFEYGKGGLAGAGIFYGGDTNARGIGGEIEAISNHVLRASDNPQVNDKNECEIVYTG